MKQKTLEFDEPELANTLFGTQNQNLAVISSCTGVKLETRGTHLTIKAESEKELAKTATLVSQLYTMIKEGYHPSTEDIIGACAIFTHRPNADITKINKATALRGMGKNVLPRTANQQSYLEALKNRELLFAIGPAGTGKTYLAVAAAVSAILAKSTKRIILTRPAVEAGEKLGYLPGDLTEKVDPYLRPLYDALRDMLEPAKVTEMMEQGTIEVAPLAFMRGRTLNDAFIILDEAQNTTPEQMKMFLTRLGANSRIVVTGDVTQIDLPATSGQKPSERSGLVQAEKVLKNVSGVEFIYFSEKDVVRHPLVAKIVNAYDSYQKENTHK